MFPIIRWNVTRPVDKLATGSIVSSAIPTFRHVFAAAALAAALFLVGCAGGSAGGSSGGGGGGSGGSGGTLDSAVKRPTSSRPHTHPVSRQFSARAPIDFCCGRSSSVRASRVFAGPNQYPPQEFAAYGILAFPSRSSPDDRVRHLMICSEYIAVLPHTSELIIPRSEQMVTIWPVDSDTDASRLNRMPRNELCEFAVNNYGLVIAKQALKDAELAGMDTSDRGPFLLAWSPSIDKGKQDALVLAVNLSDVTTFEQAQQIMLSWSDDIERDPQLWSNGWEI